MTDVKPKRIDTRKGDRHRPGYWVEYGRKRRARDKAKLTPPHPIKENGEDR